jgi:hypothetical protein
MRTSLRASLVAIACAGISGYAVLSATGDPRLACATITALVSVICGLLGAANFVTEHIEGR